MYKLTKLFLIIIFLFTSLNLTALAKPNSDGETLNLSPFVDFEVTEKKKVDVIVDIGNADYTTNQINSVINTTLKPQLTAKGIDYNIIVKDTNEGIDHFYMLHSSYNYTVNYNYNHKLYKYNINTNQLETLPINNYPMYQIVHNPSLYTSTSYYDPALNTLLLTKGRKDINLNTNTFNSVQEYEHTGTNYYSRLDSTSQTYYFSNGTLYSIQLYDGGNGTTRSNNIYTIRRVNNELQASRKEFYEIFYHWYVNNGYRVRQLFAPNGRFFVDKSVPSDFYNGRYETGYAWFEELYIDKQNFKHTSTLSYGAEQYPSTPYYFLNENEYIYYGIGYNHATSIYPIAYKSRHKQYLNENVPKVPMPQYDSQEFRNNFNENTRMYKNQYDDEKQVYVKVSQKKLEIAKGFGGVMQDITLPLNSTQYNQLYWLSTFGNNILLEFDAGFTSHYYLYNVETGLFNNVGAFTGNIETSGAGTRAHDNMLVFNYPDDYEAKTYLMKDIIDEKNHRYDADVYYVRLDNNMSEQFVSSKKSVEIANLLSENNMTFIGVGNSTAKPYHDNMLKLIDYNGKTILNTNIDQAFNEVTNFIVNKKEIDLHILKATTSSVTATQIQTITNQIRNDLRASNYMINVNQVEASPNNLYNLIQEVKWDDYKNNYIFSLDSSSLNELDTEESISIIASTMNTHYAHFASYGTTANKNKRQSVLSLMDGRGYVSQLTSTSSITTELKNYIINTAESNPKRHMSKLVLKHNPVTDEYSSEINFNAYYYDTEGDREKAERFKTEHDPTVYENHTGLMANTGTYLNSAITRFTKVGKYEIVAQKQDTPTNNNARFAHYDLWSEDSLSRLVLYVHRQPVAQFQAYFNSSNQFVLNDLSYDLDNYSKHAKGLLKWSWKYKKTTDADWTIGKPSNLSPTSEYVIALKVQDIDEAWSNEYMQMVGANLPPIANFEITPSKLSWTKNPTITDRSYSPSNLPIVLREWKVYRAGQLLMTTTSTPSPITLRNIATQTFGNVLGQYQFELVVTDSAGQKSNVHKLTLEWINYAPIPLFEIEQPLYRDTITTINNLTGATDLDGENLSFNWTFKKDNYTFTSTDEFPTAAIKYFGIGKEAVGRWEATLSAKDTLQTEGKLTKEFVVLNHTPTSSITGEELVYVGDEKIYLGSPADEDSEDVASLKSYWKVTNPTGQVTTGYTANMSVKFSKKGKYLLEHWVVDQLEESSPVYTKEIQVGNIPPIADFTMSPNPTYRNTPIDFKSLSYDEDGYITSYNYLAENEQGQISLLSNEFDFTRLFNSVGNIKVTHTVTDDDGESSSISKTLRILNHPPVVNITVPISKDRNNPTVFNNLTPIFNWEYEDIENDSQKSIQLILKKIGSVSSEIYNNTITHANYQIQSPISLVENQTYSVQLRVYDGYSWSEYSDNHYFKIVLNRPPVADFEIIPTNIYQNDTVTIKNTSSDPDGDILTAQYTLTYPNGTTENITTYDIVKTFTEVGNYRLKLVVRDPKGASDEITKTFTVKSLALDGYVKHTEQWEENRKNYNMSITGTSNSPRSQNVFFAGEKFILEAITTNTTTSTTKPQFVKVTLKGTNYSTTLTSTNNVNWSGELWNEEFTKLKGTQTFKFETIYSGSINTGVTKVVEVDVIIDLTIYDYARLHRIH